MYKTQIEIPFEKVNRLRTWTEFEESVTKIKESLVKINQQLGSTYVSDMLFRGQANSTWALETTLDRETQSSDYSILEYNKIVECLSVEIVKKFRTSSNTAEFDEIFNFSRYTASPEGLQYTRAMAYLRHHGFPSPLLDWTSDHNVAAYFAFSENLTSEFVAIYIFIEYLGGGKMMFGGKPRIHSFGPNMKVHSRHKRQRSQYTMCWFSNKSGSYYSSHENVLNIGNRAQDVALKFEIPSSERHHVLDSLRSKGITACNLMGVSEDTFVKDLSLAKFSFNFPRTRIPVS